MFRHPTEIFRQHSLLEDISFGETTISKDSVSKIKKGNNKNQWKPVKKPGGTNIIPSFNPKMAPGIVRGKKGHQASQPSSEYNRKARRAVRYGHNRNMKMASQ